MTDAAGSTDLRASAWLRAAAIALTVAAIAFAGLIAAGVFDPQPVGPLTQSYSLEKMAVPAGKDRLNWVEPPSALEGRTTSWRLTAAHAAGESDSGYGLALGSDDRALVVAVSPLGYAAVWERNAAGEPTTVWLPWQPWPHVAAGQAPNEIWLDIVPGSNGDQVTARVNREVLWSGPVGMLASGSGMWTQSFGNDVTIDFRHLERYDAAPQ